MGAAPHIDVDRVERVIHWVQIKSELLSAMGAKFTKWEPFSIACLVDDDDTVLVKA